MRRELRNAALLLALSAGFLGCVTPQKEPAPVAMELKDVVPCIPSHVPDREGWAEDVLAAIHALDKTPTEERICAVLAVIEQESGYQTDPQVPHLPRIVREGLEKKFAKLGPFAKSALSAFLGGKADGSDESFESRIKKLRTEKDLDRLFRDIAETYKDKLPGTYALASAMSMLLGKGSLQDLNPVTTAGSMQVKVDYARERSQGLSDSAIREQLYTRSGGILYGTARLIDYPASYNDIIFRFADFNAGVYASRNAAFQSMLAELTGRKLALDGDLLAYDSDGKRSDVVTNSLEALLVFGDNYDLSSWFIKGDVKGEKSVDFEETRTWERLREAWKEKTGKEPPYARMPEVQLSSPKLAKNRSTAWFATRVKDRYLACRHTAGKGPQPISH